MSRYMDLFLRQKRAFRYFLLNFLLKSHMIMIPGQAGFTVKNIRRLPPLLSFPKEDKSDLKK